ncbi:MAG: aminotransferase class V-fold PLP-dependent enzyme [Chloroflexota bacterium]
MIYLDNAATSWPKPPQVMQAMQNFMERAGGNPGRSGHRLSIEAGRIVYDTREAVAEFFGAGDPLRVVFTLNGTHALNLAMRGLLRAGQRVVTSGMEHNAVMRPLRALEEQGVEVAVVLCAADGQLDPEELQAAVTPGTRLVVINHASNVTGTLLPIEAAARIAHAAGALLLVDTAQSAGSVPIHMADMGIDLLAFTGHKGLLGPTGTGGLILSEEMDPALLDPLVRGGTGSRSEFERQPDDLPDRFESGTPNGMGIAGLGAGIAWVQERGLETVRRHEVGLMRRLRDGLSGIKGVRLFGPENPELATAVLSFTIEGKHVSEIGQRLDEEFGVLCRVGLHCAPAAHQTIGSFREGTVRLAPSAQTTEAEIDAAVRAVEAIAK